MILPIKLKHLALAVLCAVRSRARRVVVVEEAVQARAVDHRIPRVEEAEAKRVAVSGKTGAVVWVFDGGVGGVGTVFCVWVGLVVAGVC